MEKLEQEFIDLRNWKDEISRVCGIFKIASGQVAEILVLNPATFALMRQLSMQSFRTNKQTPFPEGVDGDAQGIKVGPELNLQLKLQNDLPLSIFQVQSMCGCSSEISEGL